MPPPEMLKNYFSSPAAAALFARVTGVSGVTGGQGANSFSFIPSRYIRRAFSAASSLGSSIAFFSTSGSRSRRSAFSASPLAIRKRPLIRDHRQYSQR